MPTYRELYRREDAVASASIAHLVKTVAEYDATCSSSAQVADISARTRRELTARRPTRATADNCSFRPKEHGAMSAFRHGVPEEANEDWPDEWEDECGASSQSAQEEEPVASRGFRQRPIRTTLPSAGKTGSGVAGLSPDNLDGSRRAGLSTATPGKRRRANRLGDLEISSD